MSRGALTLYLDTPENTEVAGGVALPFTQGNLTEQLQTTLALSPEQQSTYRLAAKQRVRERYSWDAVTDAYETLLTGLARR
ncbi:MAG: hypothetical protein H7039_01905 [Bryobacteraceae bacterium]|nr:hypothetical protein [Bryobacteraceae bacterium]